MEEPQLSNEQTEQRAGRGREPAAEMPPEEVIKLINRFQESGVEVWLDGGWGVDALLGEQRRSHDDLDIVVDLEDVSRVEKTLTTAGYVRLGGEAPMSFELVNPQGQQVDVHPVAFNEAGDGVYKMRTGEEWGLSVRWLHGQRRDPRQSGAMPDSRSAHALPHRL